MVRPAQEGLITQMLQVGLSDMSKPWIILISLLYTSVPMMGRMVQQLQKLRLTFSKKWGLN